MSGLGAVRKHKPAGRANLDGADSDPHLINTAILLTCLSPLSVVPCLRKLTGIHPDKILRCKIQNKVLCGVKKRNKKTTPYRVEFLVGMSGLEPPTPTLSGWCSNQLSYIPLLVCFFDFTSVNLLVEIVGLEPTTSCVQGRRSSQTELYPHTNA